MCADTLALVDEYLELLETKQAGKRYLKDWHFVHAFKDHEPVYTYVHCQRFKATALALLMY